jgi:hypothetical protein
MALYPFSVGDLPMPSDINQIVNMLTGAHDVGQLNLAPKIQDPTTTGFSLTAQAGSSLGVGQYGFQFGLVTGQYKTNGTLVKTGETLPTPSLTITTTSGNTTVKITLPTTGLPASVIAFNIYRTSVGGTDYKLIATVKVGNTSYIDSTADASRGTQTPPTANTTGTILSGLMYGSFPYMFLSHASGFSISSTNTLINVPINVSADLGQAGAVSLTLGHDANGDYIYIPVGGVYVVQAELWISGLNNAQVFQFLSRRYLSSGSYGDDQQGMYGYSGLGNNYGSGKQGLQFIYQSAWACDAGGKIYFFAQCSEAPRTINGYSIQVTKVG